MLLRSSGRSPLHRETHLFTGVSAICEKCPITASVFSQGRRTHRVVLPSNCYDDEKRRAESASWGIQTYFDERHDNLLLFIRDPHETERIASLVHQACKQYGKELRIINADDSI